MLVLQSKYDSCGDVEPTGIAVRLPELDALVDTVTAADQGRDVLVAIGVPPAGVWR